MAGLISGALRPRPLWAHYLGAIAGQLGYAAMFIQVGPLILLGAVFLVLNRKRSIQQETIWQQ